MHLDIFNDGSCCHHFFRLIIIITSYILRRVVRVTAYPFCTMVSCVICILPVVSLFLLNKHDIGEAVAVYDITKREAEKFIDR